MVGIPTGPISLKGILAKGPSNETMQRLHLRSNELAKLEPAKPSKPSKHAERKVRRRLSLDERIAKVEEEELAFRLTQDAWKKAEAEARRKAWQEIMWTKDFTAAAACGRTEELVALRDQGDWPRLRFIDLSSRLNRC